MTYVEPDAEEGPALRILQRDRRAVLRIIEGQASR